MNQSNAFLSTDRVPLRPLTVGQVIGQAFSLYRKLPAPFWLLLIVVSVPIALVSALATQAMDSALTQSGIDLNTLSANSATALSQLTPEQLTAWTTSVLGAAIVVVGVVLIGTLVRSVLIDSVLTYITAEYRLGRTVTLGAALTAVRDRWPALAAGQVMFYLLLIGLTLGLAVILFACGLGFGLLAYVYLALGLLITPVLTLERVDATQGLGRSWQLGKARFWPLVAVFAVAFAFSLIVSFILSFVSTVLPATISNLTVSVVIASCAAMVLTPFLPMGATILYLDTRVRLEGFGEAFQRLTNIASAEPHPSDVLPPVPARGGFTNNDWINLALTTAGVIVLLLIYVGMSLALTSGVLH